MSSRNGAGTHSSGRRSRGRNGSSSIPAIDNVSSPLSPMNGLEIRDIIRNIEELRNHASDSLRVGMLQQYVSHSTIDSSSLAEMSSFDNPNLDLQSILMNRAIKATNVAKFLPGYDFMRGLEVENRQKRLLTRNADFFNSPIADLPPMSVARYLQRPIEFGQLETPTEPRLPEKRVSFDPLKTAEAMAFPKKHLLSASPKAQSRPSKSLRRDSGQRSGSSSSSGNPFREFPTGILESPSSNLRKRALSSGLRQRQLAMVEVQPSPVSSSSYRETEIAATLSRLRDSSSRDSTGDYQKLLETSGGGGQLSSPITTPKSREKLSISGGLQPSPVVNNSGSNSKRRPSRLAEAVMEAGLSTQALSSIPRASGQSTPNSQLQSSLLESPAAEFDKKVYSSGSTGQSVGRDSWSSSANSSRRNSSLVPRTSETDSGAENVSISQHSLSETSLLDEEVSGQASFQRENSSIGHSPGGATSSRKDNSDRISSRFASPYQSPQSGAAKSPVSDLRRKIVLPGFRAQSTNNNASRTSVTGLDSGRRGGSLVPVARTPQAATKAGGAVGTSGAKKSLLSSAMSLALSTIQSVGPPGSSARSCVHFEPSILPEISLENDMEISEEESSENNVEHSAFRQGSSSNGLTRQSAADSIKSARKDSIARGPSSDPRTPQTPSGSAVHALNQLKKTPHSGFKQQTPDKSRHQSTENGQQGSGRWRPSPLHKSAFENDCESEADPSFSQLTESFSGTAGDLKQVQSGRRDSHSSGSNLSGTPECYPLHKNALRSGNAKSSGGPQRVSVLRLDSGGRVNDYSRPQSSVKQPIADSGQRGTPGVTSRLPDITFTTSAGVNQRDSSRRANSATKHDQSVGQLPRRMRDGRDSTGSNRVLEFSDAGSGNWPYETRQSGTGPRVKVSATPRSECVGIQPPAPSGSGRNTGPRKPSRFPNADLLESISGGSRQSFQSGRSRHTGDSRRTHSRSQSDGRRLESGVVSPVSSNTSRSYASSPRSVFSARMVEKYGPKSPTNHSDDLNGNDPAEYDDRSPSRLTEDGERDYSLITTDDDTVVDVSQNHATFNVPINGEDDCRPPSPVLPSVLDRLDSQPAWFANISLLVVLVKRKMKHFSSDLDESAQFQAFQEACIGAGFQLTSPTPEQREKNEKLMKKMERSSPAGFYYLCTQHVPKKEFGESACPYSYFALLRRLIPFHQIIRRLVPISIVGCAEGGKK